MEIDKDSKRNKFFEVFEIASERSAEGGKSSLVLRRDFSVENKLFAMCSACREALREPFNQP